MLKDELAAIRHITGQFIQDHHGHPSGNTDMLSFSEMDGLIQKIKENWTNAVFSDTTSDCLKRYFRFHLEGILTCLDTLSVIINKSNNYTIPEKAVGFQSKLFELIDFQQQQLTDYFHGDAIAPAAYRLNFVARVRNKVDQIASFISRSNIDQQLKDLLTDYLSSSLTGFGEKPTRFRSLNYLDLIIQELGAIELNQPDINQQLFDLLTVLNFNHLGFFKYSLLRIRSGLGKSFDDERIVELSLKLGFYDSLPDPDVAYNYQWPKLKSMLTGWLNEEIARYRTSIPVPSNRPVQMPQKLTLNLSVAHVACLLRLFIEEGVFKNPVLKDIFNAVTLQFSSKRRQTISHGSLSKEYYSSSQVTAA